MLGEGFSHGIQTLAGGLCQYLLWLHCPGASPGNLRVTVTKPSLPSLSVLNSWLWFTLGFHWFILRQLKMSIFLSSFTGLKQPSRRSRAWGLVSRATQPTGGCSSPGSSRYTLGSTTCSSECFPACWVWPGLPGVEGARVHNSSKARNGGMSVFSLLSAESCCVWFCGWNSINGNY